MNGPLGLDEDELNPIIQGIQKSGLIMIIQGDLQDFLGSNIKREVDSLIYLCNPSNHSDS